MKTAQPELGSEAAIYAEGTPYSGAYLAGCYESCCRDEEAAGNTARETLN